MAVQVPAGVAGSPPLQRAPSVSTWSRFYGLGSVFAKTIRDSRRSFIFALMLLAGLMLLVGSAIPTVFSNQAARDDMAQLAKDLAATAQGTSGKPINVGTVGGYLQWKYGPVFLLIASIWSILALSSTLAGEARNGSLDFVAASPNGKRRIAIEKVAGHVTVMAVVLAIMAFAGWLAGAAFGKLPGDAIPMPAALAYVLGLGLSALFFGGLAFVLAQFLGRSAGAGIAGSVLLVGWIANGYGSLTPALAALGDLTPWAWTADYAPLAGQYDWLLLAPLAAIAVVLLAIGVEAFARGDVGAAASIQTPGLPAFTLGSRGPISRELGERLPFALAWGFGIGVFGLALAAISRFLADRFGESPDIQSTFGNIFPTTDVSSATSFLQLLIQLVFIVAGFAAATFVAGWASDETSGRLEMLLTTPMSRGRWAALSGIGAYLATAVMTVLAAAGIGIGALVGGMDPLTPMAGSLTLGLFAAAAAGVGFAVGGAIRASIAAEIVMLIVVITYLTDFIAPALKLPDWVHQLALTAHFGQPVTGNWDWAGVVACLAIAAGGLLIGAWGMRRRDVGR
jgi:ABC-2 type transport system permease protein